MASSGRGADGANVQGTITTSGALSGSPKLTFAQNATGDTVTRSAGTWDTGDGFAIGQKISITGALNAGTFTITNITNGGKTLVLDAQKTVNEGVTAALSIVGAVDTPAEVAPITGDDSLGASKPITDAPVEDSPINSDDSPEASGRASVAPGRAIRSGAEIANMLLTICDEELAVTAYLEKGEMLFVSRVRAVDPDFGRIVLDYSQWKPANSALLACKQVQFHCEYKNRHIQFLADAPAEVVFGGNAGIQVGFPKFILDLQQRTHRRFRVASQPALWCVIKQEGSDPIVANVDDISRGGLGGIVHDPGVVLKPGTIIKNCQITGSSLNQPIDVSIEVRYLKTIRSPEGTLSKRVGCRFLASSTDLQELIDVFIVDLEDD